MKKYEIKLLETNRPSLVFRRYNIVEKVEAKNYKANVREFFDFFNDKDEIIASFSINLVQSIIVRD